MVSILRQLKYIVLQIFSQEEESICDGKLIENQHLLVTLNMFMVALKLVQKDLLTGRSLWIYRINDQPILLSLIKVYVKCLISQTIY